MRVELLSNQIFFDESSSTSRVCGNTLTSGKVAADSIETTNYFYGSITYLQLVWE